MNKAQVFSSSPRKQRAGPRVLHLYRTLQAPPEIAACAQVHVRSFHPQDLEPYLALFRAAFKGLVPPVRPWDHGDFQRQFLAKPWWSPERCLLACAGRDERIIGSVTLAVHATARGPLGAIHWLMVAPGFRRRGVGRLLLSHLEQQAWDQGVRLIRVETHAGWRSALQFYQRCGYRFG